VFPAFANLPVEEFERVAKEKFNMKYGTIVNSTPAEPTSVEMVTNEVGTWVGFEEADFALTLFNKYITGNNITNESDRDLLKSCINFETQIHRIQTFLNREAIEAQRNGTNPGVPINELRSLAELTTKVIEIKKLLGLSEEKKKNDPLVEWNQWLKKMKIWSEELYAGSRYRECPSCGKPLMFLLRPEAWLALKNPWFRDKVLCNNHLWKLYKAGTITLLDVCKVLLGEQCMDDSYGKWLEHRIYCPENIDPLMESTDRESDGT
jgi:hypothetical protein